MTETPRRRIRYLSSEGIHPREIKGVGALDRCLPAHWTFYAGLQYYPGHDVPIEIDLVVLTDDRVLLVELKDWTQRLRYAGDQWIVGRGNRRPSPSRSVAVKARKLKTLIQKRLPQIRTWVDSCVVLTATPTVEDLPVGEARAVFSLAEAETLGDPIVRRERLARFTLGPTTPKPFQHAAEFDELFGDTRTFRRQEADFQGFKITEDGVFAHPRGIWAEHRAEATTRANSTALLRCWDFSRLPPELNTQEKRKFVAERERRVLEQLNAVGSRLADGSAVLRPVSLSEDAVPTDHNELLALPATWLQALRYGRKTRGQLRPEELMDVLSDLVTIVAELHDAGITHRDIAASNVWIGGPGRVALTGFMVSQLPTDESVGPWREILQGYAEPIPEDLDAGLGPSGPKRRDVFLLGRVARALVEVSEADPTEGVPGPQPGSLPAALGGWIDKATASDPQRRFSDARVMADDLAAIRAAASAEQGVDKSRLDAFETTTNPYSRWRSSEVLATGDADIFRAADPAGSFDVVVKVWPGVRRGGSMVLDIALLRLLEGASRLKISPVAGLPVFEEVGLSRVGPFVVYQVVAGEPLDRLDGEWAHSRAVQVAADLLRAVLSLHRIGYAHGDLCPRNVMVGEGENGEPTTTIVDLFDIAEGGFGAKRTPGYCPDDHETVGDLQIDRFAASKICKELLDRTPHDDRLVPARKQLEAVLASGGAASLDFALDALVETARLLERPEPVRFAVALPDLDLPTRRVSGSLLARAFERDGSRTSTLTSPEFELVLRTSQTGYVTHRIGVPTFRSLEDATAFGVELRLTLDLAKGPVTGTRELATFLSEHPEIPVRVDRPTASVSRKGGRSAAQPGASKHRFPVRRHWERVLEIEEELLPEIEIVSVVEGAAVPTFGCRRVGGEFDFDPQDTVEVELVGRSRPIGTLDLASLGAETVVVRDLDYPLKRGDRLRLVSRRSRPSFERRRRAVERIMAGNAQIPDLLDYFDASAPKETSKYEVDVDDRDLVAYELNDGQIAAFHHILRTGPVGLLQGPPGTGKTRFIAAFVHWLTTKGGAEKVLLVSQSHEAVNAAIETLINRFKTEKDKLGLLRIGTKGITDKIRPFHTASLRERYRERFESGMKMRVASAAAAVGVGRRLAYDAVEIERTMGWLSRRLDTLEGELTSGALDRDDVRSRTRMTGSVAAAFRAAGEAVFGAPADDRRHREELARAYTLARLSAGAEPADLKALLRILDVSRSWLAALSTSHRNFDEFLARTRAIIAGTCVGIGQTSLRVDTNSFDWVIVDEAARCTSGELAVAAQLGRRLLLVGDQRQLPPMLDERYEDGLSQSFPGVSLDILMMSEFERAFTSEYGSANRQVLHEQYRMTDPICELVGTIFYEPHGVRLITSPNREADPRFAGDLPRPMHHAITWVDTSREPRNTERRDAKRSRTNAAEVAAVVSVLESIAADKPFVQALASGEDENPIGVICMYSAQRDAIETALAERPLEPRFRRLLKIETVDSYQGKENSIVVTSLTCFNKDKSTGHVSSPNRCNVALSRAKERLVIVGAADFWRDLDPTEEPMTRVLGWIEKEAKANGARAKVVDPVTLSAADG